MTARTEKGGAVIIMAKAPGTEYVMTRLRACLSDEQRIRLYGALLERAVRRLRSVPGAHTFIAFWPPHAMADFRHFGLEAFPQSEGDIGAKMHGAIQEALARGYGKAVAVGVDIPELTQAVVLEAFGLLDESDVVFGPATDGGYYLVGMKAPREELFEGVQWSSEETLGQSMKRARELGLRVSLLQPLDDIDTPADLERHPHLME